MADLMTISYDKLMRQDTAETGRLLSACQRGGFFYLDLSGSERGQYLDLVAGIIESAAKYFAQPIDIKMRDSRKDTPLSDVCGFKTLGTETGVVENKKDGFEAFKIPADYVNQVGDLKKLRLSGLKTHLHQLPEFVKASQDIAIKVLSTLSNALECELKDADRYEHGHQPKLGSKSTAVVNYYPLQDLPSDSSIGHNAHTDMGTLTILFCNDWGLQAYSDEKGWKYVVPQPNCAVVNVGDSLRFLSQGKLKSSLHRVVPHETWNSKARLSLAYFLRPNRTLLLTDPGRKQWTVEEWINRKFKSYKETHAEQKMSAVQTGRHGFLGVWEGPEGSVKPTNGSHTTSGTVDGILEYVRS